MLGEDFLNRFGPYRLQDYSMPLYAGGAIGGGPSGGTIPVPAPTPTPAPTSTPIPTPTPRPGNNNNNGGQNQHGGSGPGGVGNAGGASHGVGGGGGGDNAGHPGYGNNAASSSAGAGGFDGGLFGGMFNFGPNQGIDLSPWGAGALQALTFAPYGIGTAASIAQLLGRGFNTANADAVRTSLGAPSLDFGQVVGSLLGLNDYGALGGNQKFIDIDQNRNPINNQPVGVSAGGINDPGLLQRLFAGDKFGTTYTPEEKRLRDLAAAAAAGNAGGAKNGGANSDVGFGPGNYSSPTGAPSGPAVTSGGGNTNNNNNNNGGHAGNAAGANNNSGSNAGVNSGGVGSQGNPLGAGGNNQNGGMMARGGYVRGRPDRFPDNRKIHANEGEFVVRNTAAAAAGPRLLGLINTPAGARRVRALLGL